MRKLIIKLKLKYEYLNGNTHKDQHADSAQSEKTQSILHKWQLEGKNTVQIAPGGMPQHPEFIYRLPVYGGEWPGWNAFLGIQMDENPEAFQKNIEQE